MAEDFFIFIDGYINFVNICERQKNRVGSY